ncbi:MAG: glutamate-5-semialdehyde dehydrogenase [Chloroflexi bacterium]|nr:glutamate-5-semialdehyde dehydrogenase [Chloroflexota bacterium]
MTVDLKQIGLRARAASKQIARAPTEIKNQTLLSLAGRLWDSRADILAANALDIADATAAGLDAALIDRLTLNETRLKGIADDLRRVAELPDPVGEIFDATTLPNGLKLHKQRVPLGVLGVIYESRPNVTIDVAGLAIKTGNAAILRGGSETIRSNRALVGAVHGSLSENGLPAESIQFIDDPDRARVTELLNLHEHVDIIIPRGGNALHEFCREHSKIPVMTGGIGICHLFVDESADLEGAYSVIHNAKTQRPTVCNALDTVLVHRAVADSFLPDLVHYLSRDGVTFRADDSALPYLYQHFTGAYLDHDPDSGEERLRYAKNVGKRLPESVLPAGPDDFDTEWLSLVLGLKVVDSLDEAIAHIAAHSTGHSDGILTRDDANAQKFVAEVDSAAVYVNASTRFTDGSQFGLGAEVAISTQRLHARGPMGLRELTTHKWVAVGDYHIRD